MSAPKKTKGGSGRARIAVLVAGLLAVAALGYLLAISPKRSEAAGLEREIAQVEAQMAEYRAGAPGKAASAVKAAELFKLAKAMPDETNISGVMLELSQVAADTGIVFDTIEPQPAVPHQGYEKLPISLVFRGNFYNLSDFLYRLRNLVHARDGELTARGRFFSLSEMKFVEDEKKKFPHIKAELTVEAFVFGGGLAAPAAQEGAATPSDGTTSTSTTTTPGSTTPSATAAGGGSGS